MSSLPPSPLPPSEVLRRARSILGWRDAAGRPPVYRLPYPNGGSDPARPHPFASHEGRAVCDCSGFVAWCLGVPRRRPGYGKGGPVDGYVSTDSMYWDATKGPRAMLRPAVELVPGLVLVYPGRFAAGLRIGVGHTGILASVPAGIPAGTPEWWRLATAIHCSSGNSKQGHAVSETSAAIWGKRGVILAWG